MNGEVIKQRHVTQRVHSRNQTFPIKRSLIHAPCRSNYYRT